MIYLQLKTNFTGISLLFFSSCFYIYYTCSVRLSVGRSATLNIVLAKFYGMIEPCFQNWNILFCTKRKRIDTKSIKEIVFRLYNANIVNFSIIVQDSECILWANFFFHLRSIIVNWTFFKQKTVFSKLIWKVRDFCWN